MDCRLSHLALGVALVGALISACRGPLQTPTRFRTYSQDIRPITSGRGCRNCHANPAVGTYEMDHFQRGMVSRMARLFPGQSKLSAEQLRAIQDWVLAGAPDDSQPF